MNSTRLYRPRRRRTPLLPLACGCLAALGILTAIVIVGAILLLPQIIGRVMGLTPQGQTAQVFAQVTPQPTLALQNATEPAQITVDLGQYGQQTLNNGDPQLYNFSIGTSNGQQAAQVTFTEAGLMQLCQQRSTVCGANSTDPRFSNARIDLQPGGAIVYLDVTLPQTGNIPFPAGIVLRWDQPTMQVVFAGVDIGGTLYTSPPQSLADTISTVTQQMNELIQQVAVETGGGRYTVSDVIVTDTTLTIVGNAER